MERRVDVVLWDQDLVGIPFLEVTFKDSDVGEAAETLHESRYRAFTFEDPGGGGKYQLVVRDQTR